jgi:hypothetical protein
MQNVNFISILKFQVLSNNGALAFVESLKYIMHKKIETNYPKLALHLT